MGGFPGPLTPAPGPGVNTPGLPTGPSMDSWRYWWAFNKDRFLQLREALEAAVDVKTTSTADDLLTAKPDTGAGRPTAAQIQEEILPALFAVLERETNPDLLNAAMISIAKIGKEPDRAVPAFVARLKESNAAVAETAALSLGILGAGAAIDPLTALLNDTEAGRASCARKEVPWRVRAVAALGLGLLAAEVRNPHHRARAQEALLAIFTGAPVKSAHKDVVAGAAIALSMAPDRDQRVALTLQRYLEANWTRESLICAHIPSTIARCLSNEPAPDRERFARFLLPAVVGSGEAPRNVRPAAALALGILTRPGDPHYADVVASLRDSVDRELAKNPDTVFLALTALGEIAAASKPGNPIDAFLVERATAQGGRVATRAWAAVALGIAGFEQAKRNELAPGDPTSEALAAMLTSVRDPEQVSAYAIALGMRRHVAAAPTCARLFTDVKVDDYRGYFALALGMMRAKEHARGVHEIVKVSARRPALFQQASIGLALLGDRTIVPTLLAVLDDPKNGSFTVQSAVADSLGYVGDRQAVTPLVAIVRNDGTRHTTAARTFAAVGLGQMCDKSKLPWNSRISAHLNYFAFLETLTDLIWEL